MPLLVQILFEVEELYAEDRERGAGSERVDVAALAVLDRVVDLPGLLAVDADGAEAVLGPRRGEHRRREADERDPGEKTGRPHRSPSADTSRFAMPSSMTPPLG